MKDQKYWILHHETPVGTLITPPQEQPAIAHALQSAGYDVTDHRDHRQSDRPKLNQPKPTQPTTRSAHPKPNQPDPRLFPQPQECTIEDHHPCDVSIAAGYLHQTAEALGLEDRALAKTLTEGYTDAGIRKAMLHVRDQLHGIERQKADAAIQVAFPDHPIGK